MNTPPDAEPTAAAPASALDAAAVARLRELDPDGSRGLLVRILSVFETSLVSTLLQLRAATGEPRARTVCELAHKLKSSSASVGASRLTSACAAIESQLRPRLDADAPVAVADSELDVHSDRLAVESEATLAMVQTMLRCGPAA